MPEFSLIDIQTMPGIAIDGITADISVDGAAVDISFEELYDQSPSTHSLQSHGEDSRIESESGHLHEGETIKLQIMERDDVNKTDPNGSINATTPDKKGSSKKEEPEFEDQTRMEVDSKPTTLKSKQGAPKKNKNAPRRKLGLRKYKNNGGDQDDQLLGLENPDLGPFLLKQALDLIASGDSPQKALQMSVRAAKSIERCSNGKLSLDLVMSLHVSAAMYCRLGQYSDAIKVLEHSIEIIPVTDQQHHQEHSLAKFAGYMQLGDTYSILGKLESSMQCYRTGLDVQKLALGDLDPQVGETCRYLAEAYVQALQFDKAQSLSQIALQIRRQNGGPATLEEAEDRRLMGLICEAKGDHESALEHLVLASMAMVSNGSEEAVEVAAVDLSIGDAYLSLLRYDEAVFAYQKALTVFKTAKGENHPSVGSVFVRLAELYNKTGKFREAKSCCENALRIYEKPLPGIPLEEFASGLTNVSAVYESMNEVEEAVNLLNKALKIYNNDAPGKHGTIVGIEAQIGVMYYVLGKYTESYNSFKSAVLKLRASGEKKSAFFGVVLNQMGLACVERYAIDEAKDLFEEARSVLEHEYGPCHPETLGVYSNLAGTYDALGRLDDAIKLLEFVVKMREEKLGTANPDVDDEKQRLAELLKEAGRVWTRKN